MIYALQNKVNFWIKFGHTYNFYKRHSQLSIIPESFNVLNVVNGGRALDRAIRAHFEFFRVPGKKDWFYPHPALLEFIRNGFKL